MIKTTARINNEKLSRRLFIFCWVIYTAAYLGRLNYSAALASIINEGVFSKSNAGLIGTLFFLCYGIGQLINGIIADRVSPYKMIFSGVLVSSLANLGMILWKNYIYMAVIWGINGIAQSMLWSPILFIITNVLHERMSYRASVIIAASAPVGTLLAYFSAAVCVNYNWQYVFVISSAVLALFAVLWFIGTNDISARLKGSEGEVTPEAVKTAADSAQTPENVGFMRIFILSGLFIFVLPVMAHGMLKEGIVTWIPTMITETYGSSPSFSIFLSMILPVINLSGAFIAMFIYNRIVRKNEITGSLIILSVAVLPLIPLIFIGKINLTAAILMLALVTTLMHAFNMYAITLVPMRFGKYGRTATVTGLLNSITYIGSALSSFVFGVISEKFGWQNTVLLWIGIALCAALLCFLALRRWRGFIKDNVS